MENKMTMESYSDRAWDLISQRFRGDFPEYFVKNQTLNKEEYGNANSSGYSFYSKIMNSGVSHRRLLYLYPNYKVSDGDFDMDELLIQKERQRVLDDIANCSDIRIWCFDNITLKN